MNLDYSIKDFIQIVEGELYGNSTVEKITQIHTDTRKILITENSAFFSLKGNFRDGNEFVFAAFEKGIRVFIVSELPDLEIYKDCIFVLVSNGLEALQKLATYHRSQFRYPVIAITGSNGKTTVKEYLYHFLKRKYRIVRSPKSYNSQLGVALSLLEMTDNYNLALIEVGISQEGEMEILEKMIDPTYGVFTGFGQAHRYNFADWKVHLTEKLILFRNTQKNFFTANLDSDCKIIIEETLENVKFSSKEIEIEKKNYNSIQLENLKTTHLVCEEFDITSAEWEESIKDLPILAMRMEQFDGIQNNLILNDTYNMDKDALLQSLEYQLSIAKNRKRIVILGLDKNTQKDQTEITELVDAFKPDQLIFFDNDAILPIDFKDSVILIKGSRSLQMQKLAQQFRIKKHKTFIEINLSALRHNLTFIKSLLKPTTKILAMVKASAYGNGIEKISGFLKNIGTEYFGVAYADEGVELRSFDSETPILVMNAESEAFEDCINFNLEPAIYSFDQLNEFVEELIVSQKINYPIHIKLDTGMNRLGFLLEDINEIAEAVLSQPEVYVKSVYSHLADSDNQESTGFTLEQLNLFEKAANKLESLLGYNVTKHILNSEGVLNHRQGQFDMVRLGIAMYGISNLHAEKLEPVISWYSAISQIREIKKGECVGYNCAFVAKQDMTIAIVPVGYGDGFKRTLGEGKGGVYLKNKFCSVLGKVCMDMIIVDVTGLNAEPKNEIEIIGEYQNIIEFAKRAGTIPYDILTGFSQRVHRIYIED